jgi:hypothetical protein
MFHDEWQSKIKTLIAGSTLVLIAACSSTPAETPPSEKVAATPAVAPTIAVAAAPATPATATTPAQTPDTINGQPLSPDRIVALQKAGYTFVDRDGQTYACRRDTKTGSRLARETVCMTPAQADALREETQRRLGDMMRNVPPPQGK